MSEHRIAVPPRPDRPPDFTKHFPEPPDTVPSFVTVEDWLPTGAEPGQQRSTITARPEQARAAIPYRLAHTIGVVAAAGMADSFARSGLSVSHAERTPREDGGGTTIHELTIAYTSAEALIAYSRQAEKDAPGRHFTFCQAPAEQCTDPVQLVTYAATRRLMIPPAEPGKRPSETASWQRRTSWAPAWECLPPLITTKLHDLAAKTYTAHWRARSLPEGPEKEEALLSAAVAIDNVADGLLSIDIEAIAAIIEEREEIYMPKALGSLLGLEETAVRQAILEHIKNPRPEDVLVASSSVS